MTGFGLRAPGVAIAMLVSAALLRAQTPQSAPTFRSEINYVELTVRVLDAKGGFVRDLQQSDFQIFEDGARQEISFNNRN
jgi:hypothetical protein